MAGFDDQPSATNVSLSCILSHSDQYLKSRSFVPPSSQSDHVPRIHVELPEPPALLSALVAAGAKSEVAEVMQATYHQRACEFREQALAIISRTCSKLAQVPSMCSHISEETIIAALKQKYLDKLNSWRSEALLQAKWSFSVSCREDNENIAAKTKTFNHQYVPLLEHFFGENPFPTHADKVFLAKKSNMTYRQIHVWFQNRRNRTKNKKLVSEEATIIPLDILTRKIGKFAFPPTTKSAAPPSGRSTPLSSTRLDIGGSVTPPHAFPTTYPPRCGYEPFSGAPMFAVSEWPRQPVIPSQRPRQSNIDIDELTEKFSRLNVWDDSLDRSRGKAGKVIYDGFAATFAITVRPSPAPHPACMRTALTSPAPPRVTCRPKPAPASGLHPFRSPSPDSPMTTLIPPYTRRRKIAPIPKRIPSELFTHGWKSLGHLNDPPSLASSTRSLSVGSETLTEDSGSDNNSSSHLSSAATTPESSPSPLSHPS